MSHFGQLSIVDKKNYLFGCKNSQVSFFKKKEQSQKVNDFAL